MGIWPGPYKKCTKSQKTQHAGKENWGFNIIKTAVICDVTPGNLVEGYPDYWYMAPYPRRLILT
jgi:hypothetical protein